MPKNPYEKIFHCVLVSLSLIAVTTVPQSALAEDGGDGVKAALSDRDWKARLAAVEKLGKQRDKKALSVLREVAGTRSEYWPVKIKAITLLGEAQDPESVELLLTIFNDTFSNWECPSIKSYSAAALGNFRGHSKIVDSLINGINDRELLTREASIQSLGKIGDSRAVPHLVALLDDKSTAIRLSVIRALEDIGDPRAIPHLKRIAETETDSVVRGEVLTALSNFHGKGSNN
jgi:HEAT repeat protein